MIFYQDSKGRCPVKTFLANLPVKDRAKVAAWIDLLEERGPELGRPYAARLEAGIYERGCVWLPCGTGSYTFSGLAGGSS